MYQETLFLWVACIKNKPKELPKEYILLYLYYFRVKYDLDEITLKS